MDTVGAAHGRRVAELARTRRDRVLEAVDGFQQEIARARERDRERRVDDVARREPVVDPRAGREANPLLDDVDERRDVVVGDALALLDRGGVDRCPAADRLGVGPRDHAELGPRLDGEELDLEPGGQPRLVGEQLGHLGQGVPTDQAGSFPSKSTAAPAMSRRYWTPGHEMRPAAS